MTTKTTTAFDPAIDYYAPSLLEKRGISASVCPQDADDSSETPQVSAEIDWTPDHDKFVKRQVSLHGLPKENDVPKGWPRALTGPLVWKGSDLDASDYVEELGDSDVAEIEEALSQFKVLNRDLDDVSSSTFKLPSLGPKLERMRDAVYNGKGFTVLRGLQPQRYSREENVIIYLGVSSYLGETRGRQYQDGRMMAHIADVKFEGVSDECRRPLFTSHAQPFHADLVCGILAMYFLDMAEKGGDIFLSSSWNVYNEVAATRPDMIHCLAKDDWIHDTFGRVPSHIARPLLHLDRPTGRVALVFSRRNLTGSSATPRSTGIPALTERQAEALDAVHFAAAAGRVRVRPRAGDVVFVNNLAVLHSRAAFHGDDSPATPRLGGGPPVSGGSSTGGGPSPSAATAAAGDDGGEDTGHRRYALRLWLHNRERGWEVPSGLRLAWDRIFAEVDEIENYWDIDPYVRRGRHLFVQRGQDPGKRSSSCG